MTRRAVCRFFAFARVCGFVSVGSCGFVCFVGGSEWRLASLNFTPQRCAGVFTVTAVFIIP